LNIEADYSFKLLGIVSSENDYTITWVINKALNIHLTKQNELEIVDKKTKTSAEFSRFSFNDEIQDITYTLISNKSDKGILIKEQSQIDFFLKIEAKTDSLSDDYLKKIKTNKEVLAIFDISPTNLKSGYNLHF